MAENRGIQLLGMVKLQLLKIKYIKQWRDVCIIAKMDKMLLNLRKYIRI
jgi:hypothetical protein